MDERVEVNKYTFSVKLADGVLRQLDFLAEIDKTPTLYGGPVLKQAIYRYETLWLPFAVKHSSETLSAPKDIAWVWHCHMLSPISYTKDCINICGTILDHSFTPSYDSQTTEKLWTEMYPDQPFHMDVNISDIKVPPYNCKLSYDLEAAASRQKVFFYQVSLPHYKDRIYLMTAVDRYRKFLSLKQANPDKFIVPCYDVDVVWHAHQLHPVAYKHDTEVLLGKHFNHDDSVNDRTEGSKLNVSDTDTRILWKETFNENFAKFGAMYRGDPPNGKLETIPHTEVMRHCTKLFRFQIKKAEIIDSRSENKIRSLKIAAEFADGTNMTLLKLKKPKHGQWSSDMHDIEYYEVDTDMSNSISFTLYKSGTLGKFGPKVEMGKGVLSLENIKSRDCQVRQQFVEETTVDISGIHVMFKQAITLLELGRIQFHLIPGEYEQCVMPEHIESMWGPVPLERLPEGVTNICSVANHRIQNAKNEVMFTARVIHSLPLLMSVVQIYYHDKLAVVCHLIGPDTLPLSAQVERTHKLTLDQAAGERAVVIKNNSGDWAILVGVWTGMRKGVPGVKGTKNSPGRAPIRGSPGHLKVAMYKTSNKEYSELSLERQYAMRDFRFSFGGMNTDLKKGVISSEVASHEVAENLALSFSISLLQVLCQPRPVDWEPGKFDGSEKREGVRIRSIPAEDLALVVAMGFLVVTPSNFHLRKKYKEMKEKNESTRLPYLLGPTSVDCTVSSPPHADFHDNFGDDMHSFDNVWEDAIFCHDDIGVDDGDPGGCGGCGGCGGGDSWGGGDYGNDGGNWGDNGGDIGDGGGGNGGDSGGGWGCDSGGDGGGWGGDSGGDGGGGCGDGGGGGCGGCGGCGG